MYAFALFLTALGTPTVASDLTVFNGEWVYTEDLTPGRSSEQLGPPMSSKFSMRSEGSVIILVSGHGSGHKDVPIRLDGTPTLVPGTAEGTYARYRGSWGDGVFTYRTDFARGPGLEPQDEIRKEFRLLDTGLEVRVWSRPTSTAPAIGLYRHPEDIPMPSPAKATINDLSWLAGAWVGTRGADGAISFEERWSPPRGGAMLAVARTVSRDRMSSFEYLRIVERGGGLVYVAQPNGASPTEFVLTEVSAKRAVFENPRHDYPKRIAYDLSEEGALSATIGYLKGGAPRRFDFKRESQ